MADSKLSVEIGAKSGKLSADLARAKGQFTNFSKDTKKTVGDIGNVFEGLGGAIGGAFEGISSSISSLMTAGGPIMLITAGIATIGKLIKSAKEDMDLFRESADKVKFGYAGYATDAEDARTKTRKRALGEILEAQKQIAAAERGSGDNRNTEEQKKIFRQQRASAQLMLEEGQRLFDSVMGHKDKVAWQLKYNKLLQEQEILSDAGKAKATEWEGLEARLVELRGVIIDKEKTAAEKKQASIEADKISAQLLKEKNAEIDKELANLTAISEMTGTQEVVESKIFALELQRNTNQKEYASDKNKVLKMENSSLKTTAAQLALEERKLKTQKEYNSHGSDGYKGIGYKGASGASTNHLKYNAPKLVMPSGANQIRPYGGTSKQELDAIQKFNTELENQELLASELTMVFDDMFSNIGQGFKAMADSLIKSIKRIATQILSKAIVFSLMNILFPGSGSAAFSIGSALKGITGYANGTAYHPGGLSLVGERGPELMNVPRGAQIYPHGQAPRMGGGELTTRVSGSDILFVLKNAERTQKSFA